MRTPLLLAASALTGCDQPYCLVSPHAAHGAGGVHRPEDHAAMAQQEFRRLNVATFSFSPCAEQLGLLSAHAVGDGEGQSAVDHLSCLLQGVDAGGENSGPQSFQLGFLFLICG